jgi:sigma-B regulation protein RsbU (phosphoserine phosphatase)
MRESPEVELAVLDPPVQPLGVLDAWLGDAPTPRQIKTGGSLIFTSDGIFEAMNADGDQYGIDRMTALLDKHRDDSPDNIIAVLCQAVHDWQGNDDPHDDQTIVVVRRI